jgi:glycosyltransferase involved in cell wall biosynthesis
MPSGSPDISIVLCTWNRASLLDGALAALTAQSHAPAHEILVVDNASTDGTRAVVARHAASCGNLRYVSEPQQGLSIARNSGIAAARAPLLAFTDDDVRVGTDWLRNIASTMGAHPNASYAGGPVSPRWPGGIPEWLTERHWAPLGVQDYGGAALRVGPERPVCLIGANLVIRRSALDRVGPFCVSVQRVRDGAGSTEDHEWQDRLWRAGGHGIYDPSLRVEAVVTADRVGKRHHRIWHFGHGRHVARMRLGVVEAARFRIAGVPAHLLRAAAHDAVAWCGHRLSRRDDRAFDCEARLCYAAGFIRERWS